MLIVYSSVYTCRCRHIYTTVHIAYCCSQYLYFTVSPEVLWGAVWIRQVAILPVIERHNFAQNIHWRIAGSSSHTTSLIPCSYPPPPPSSTAQPIPTHNATSPLGPFPFSIQQLPLNTRRNSVIFTVQQPSVIPSSLYSRNVTFHPERIEY
jgi:hypothetical protein